MSVETETVETDARQLDGKPLGGQNIFDPEYLKEQGLSLDLPEDIDEDEELEEEEPLDLEPDVEEEDVVEDPDPIEEDTDISGVLKKYKSQEEIAKALVNLQKMSGNQANELGTLRSREETLIELVRRAGITPDKTDDKDEDIAKDEYGLPTVEESYWKQEYLPELKTYFYTQYIASGYEDAEARVLAAADAVEKMSLERAAWRESYAASRAAKEREAQDGVYRQIEENAKPQQEAMDSELGKVGALAARMGLSAEKASGKVLAVAQQMVQRAIEMKQITLLEASTPEAATKAIWGAWAYLQSQGEIGSMEPEPPTPKRPHVPEDRGSGGGTGTTVAPTRKTSNYSKGHVEYAKQLNMSPEDLESKYGRLP